MTAQDRKTSLGAFVDELQQQLLAEAALRYSKKVIQHWVQPRNPGALERPDGVARITGPCGDTMEIFLRVQEGRIVDASFRTDGCGTSIAAASMAVELSLGRELDAARRITQQEILAALEGLPEENEHCALLAANTLQAALDDHLARARRSGG